MCGRYFLSADGTDDELLKILEALERRGIEAKTEGEVFPTDLVPVLVGTRADAMRWGFSKPDGKGVVINARSETAAEKPMFLRSMREMRCLIPISGYYEWGRENRAKYALGRGGRTMYLAGLYRQEWPGEPARFVILTRDAAPAIADIHARMPVVLDGDARRNWLNPAIPAEDVLKQAIEDVKGAPV